MTPVMLCAPPCGRPVVETGGRLAHLDRCPECRNHRGGDLYVDGRCPDRRYHYTGCRRPDTTRCDHRGCHAAARLDTPPCASGHDNCCGTCGCQGED